ncbi:hypothetical protein IBX35_02880, partial [Candidatus Bathyarchaeota archaeon]|nr:hypothetical protein [Candidatus Bathyarchaeota archaeon]
MINKKMKIEATLLTLLLVISIAITGSLTSVKANTNETIVYVDPPEVRDLEPSETFTINVKIANVTDLYGLDLQFGWDPTIIEYVSHTAKIPVETYPDGIMH